MSTAPGGQPSRTSAACVMPWVSPFPSECSAAFTESVADPLGERRARYARTRGPFTTAEAAGRFGLGLRVAGDALSRMALDTKLVRGVHRFPATPVNSAVRRRRPTHLAATLTAAPGPRSNPFPLSRTPVSPAWQQVGTTGVAGTDGLLTVIDHFRCGNTRFGGRTPVVRFPGPRLPAIHAR